MLYHKNILETIGDTPLVKLNKVISASALVLAKIESFNPGHSTKDRMALKMIEDAEKKGILKKGGTVIEGTSGNTGMGLALACINKGYNLICTVSDKQSKEKIDILKAMGAKVYLCPTDVRPDDPKSYYSVAKRLNEEIPNSFILTNMITYQIPRHIMKQRGLRFGSRQTVKLLILLSVLELVELSQELLNILKKKTQY